MTLNSSTTSAGAQALDSQYNNLRKDVIQRAGDYATSTGSANAYILAIDAQLSALAAGDVVKFKANFTNTGAATINVNSIGVKSIKHNANEAIIAGSIISGEIITLTYDGTNFLMAKQFRPEQPVFGTLASVSGSPTTATQLVKGGFVDMLATGYKSVTTSGSIGTAIIEISADGATGWTTLASKTATGYFQFSTSSIPIIIGLSAFVPPGYYFRCNMTDVSNVVTVVANYQAFL